MTLNYNDIKYELLNTIRSGDIFTISERGVTTTTETFVGTTGTYTLLHAPGRNIRCVINTTESETLKYGRDYIPIFTYSADGSRMYIVSIQLLYSYTATDEFSITYDYGSTEKIYPDWIQENLTIGSFPRLGFTFLKGNTEVIATDSVEATRFRMTFIIKAKSVDYVNDRLTALRQLFKNNQNTLHYSNILRVVNIEPADDAGEVGGHKIFQATMDVMNELNIERKN